MVRNIYLAIIFFLFSILQTQAQTVSFSIQAHQDDWQLFMSSRIIADMSVANSKMVFITLTAGDESCGACSYGGGGPFYLGREIGAVNSSKFAADLTTGTAPLDLPAATTVAINGHNITKYVYKNTVNYFLRLPDGNLNGNGFPNNNNQSLNKLRAGTIASISTIGINDAPPLAPTATYTGWSDLTNTIKAIINAEKITGTQSWIHTAHTNTTTYNINDHSDHTNTGIASTDAVSSGMTWVGINGFMDYYSSANPANLSETDHENASILFSLEVLGMTENQYQNDFSSGHQGWLPMDYFQILKNPSGNAPFAGLAEEEVIIDKKEANNIDLIEIPLVISITSPAYIDKDINISISPYETGQLTTTVYDMTGNKIYELITTVKNRDAFVLTLKNAVKTKGTYIIKNIINDKFIESRKIVVE